LVHRGRAEGKVFLRILPWVGVPTARGRIALVLPFTPIQISFRCHSERVW
jgi:hypothetical protein